jgi:hypothetical protein
MLRLTIPESVEEQGVSELAAITAIGTMPPRAATITMISFVESSTICDSVIDALKHLCSQPLAPA